MKGQVVVIRELFAFAIGVAVMIAMVSMFNEYILPPIKRFSVNEQAYLTLFNLHSIVERMTTLIKQTESNEIVIKLSMPKLIGSQHYKIYIDSGKLCLRTNGEISIKRCIDIVLDTTLSGNFLSGTNMQLDITPNESYFNNVVEFATSCTPVSCNDNNPCTKDTCFGSACFNTKLNGFQSGCMESSGCSGSVCSCVNGNCQNICGNNVCEDEENPMNCFSDCGIWHFVLPSFFTDSLTNNDISSFAYNGGHYDFFSNLTYDNDIQTLVDTDIYNNNSVLVVFSNKSSDGNYSLDYTFFNGSWSPVSKFCCENDENYNEYGNLDIDKESGIYWLVGYNYTNDNVFGGTIFLQNFSGTWSYPYKLYQGFYTGNPRISANYGYKIVVWDAQESIKYKYFDGVWHFSTNATEIIKINDMGDYDAPSVALDEYGNFLITYTDNHTGNSVWELSYWNGTWVKFNNGVIDNENTYVAYSGNGKYLLVYKNDTFKYKIFDSNSLAFSSQYDFPYTINFVLKMHSDKNNNPYLFGCASASDCKIFFFNKNTNIFSYYDINN